MGARERAIERQLVPRRIVIVTGEPFLAAQHADDALLIQAGDRPAVDMGDQIVGAQPARSAGV